MRSIAAACGELVDRLTAAGFRADVDPERLVIDPAGVWVSPREVRDYTLAGGATLTTWLYLIVAGVETDHALRLLDDLLSGVLDLVTPSDEDSAVDLTGSLVLPTNPSTPLPAYRVAVDLEL